VGDIESLPFLEAIRQFRQEVGSRNAIFMHLTLVPYIAAAGELKTKPTQHSVRELMEIGIQPQVLICRSEHPLDEDIRARSPSSRTWTAGGHRGAGRGLDLPGAARVPAAGARRLRAGTPHLEAPAPDLEEWGRMVKTARAPSGGRVRIAVVGKYTELVDAYKSVQEALIHGGIANDVEVDIDWLSSEGFESSDGPGARLEGTTAS
jgi:CTP synthase